MIYLDILSLNKVNMVPYKRVLSGSLLLLTVVSLSACVNKENKAGQTLARVNGEEITMLQINDELRRAGVKAAQQEAATRQLLESLIDRQLLTEEAMRNKIDRTPDVMQAIAHAKAQILAQAYLGSIMNKVSKPSMSEIEEYFHKHPEYFSRRKQYDMQQLIVATRDLSNDLKLAIDSAKSLDDVVIWLDSHNVKYARGQLSRSSADLPEQMLNKVKEIKNGQLFIVNEGDNSLLNSISTIKDSPVTVKNAAPQIEQYLINKKSREAANIEIAHLRSSARIQYLNTTAPLDR